MIPASQSYSEHVQCLGDDQDLVAVLTDPAGPAADTGILFLNAGVLHRIGPHRLHVTLARQLARLGLTGLRLDLSGIGESRPIPGTLGFRESSVADIRTAMDHLAKERELRHFILFGLCSGADNALATAAVDERVVAAVLVDAPAYATAASVRRHRLGRIPRWQGLSRLPAMAQSLLQLGARMVRARLPWRSLHAHEGESARRPPPQPEFAALMQSLLDRGTRLLLVYSGVLGPRYNAPEQFFESFPGFRGRLEVAFYPDANHVFTEIAQRRQLTMRVLDWAQDFLRERAKRASDAAIRDEDGRAGPQPGPAPAARMP
jgi:pimeloyl-ACP methyl ester carboxylesterase